MPIEPTQVSRILIVDDDEAFRVSHAALVEAFGHEPEIASDGFEALAKLIMEIDLVLLDADMPHMDGFEVARRIRSDPVHAHLPIVMVTGLTSSEDRLRALETGINDFINKPVDPYELQLRVKWLLALKRAHDALARHRAELEATVERRTEALRRALEDVSQAKRSTHEAHLDTIRRLTIAAEYRDMVTASHIERIGLYSALLAEALGMPPGSIDDIRHAAAMHDVGKIGIPDAVLLKRGSLTRDERKVMESHTEMGARILQGSDSPILQQGEVIALTHHERWDGRGYPRGLSGDDIPLEGRICAVVDVFDALATDRPYRAARDVEEVFQTIEEGRGAHFDPALVDVFCELRSEVGEIRTSWTDEAAGSGGDDADVR